MSRKSIYKKKYIFPDKIFKSILISKFINLIMLNGKKTIAEKIVYSSLKKLGKITNKDYLEVFENSINNVRPCLEIKNRKIGGSIYQIPVEINIDRSNTLAMKWIISFSRKSNKGSMINKLYNELLDSLNNKSLSIKKRDDIYRIANSNKAFANYKFN